VLLCPLNVSEGRSREVLDALAAAAGRELLDVHTDRHHHRSVLWLAGEDAPRRVAAAAVARIDLRRHQGVHPRLGAVDVVPFVGDGAADARERYVRWSWQALRVPCLAYGDGERSLPEVRRLRGDTRTAHPTAGATAVGARGALVAYNVWLAVPDVGLARRVAAAVRSPAVRALGLPVGDRVQVSMNLVAPSAVGPGAAYDAVAALAPVAGAELVGLVPEPVLLAEPEDRWSLLGLAPDRTVEARLRAAGLG
jgi:glutamate formiminotransferase